MMSQAILRNKYRDLQRHELLEKAYQLGAKFEEYSCSCSQSTVAAIHELLEIDDVVVKVSTSLCGGTAIQGLGTCGALAGGIIALDYYFGRPADRMSCTKFIKENVESLFSYHHVPPMQLAEKFIGKYGTFTCIQIQRKLYGRTYCFTDEDDLVKFEDVGSHSDPTKCKDVVGSASRWVIEILLDRGALS